MTNADTKKSTDVNAIKQTECATVMAICVCIISAVSAIFMFASLYSDCFGLGDYFKIPLPYVGFFDALVVLGFILRLSPIPFTRFVAFSIAGFAMYCAWSAGVDCNDAEDFYALFLSGYGVVAWSHIAVALLTFGFGKIISISLGLFGLVYWTFPTLAVIFENFLKKY